ncbi:hypothetical protein NDU88_005790 [Pleurodeles waltl]|uniref:Uncharacterized protein n=1 Tax=Pleurodeles waltl TaxID=8319 RepID=A0AAV7NNH1_PLEWA|nr:hypothetical protein NDU88_005790 [Pleurodeles waltl]
MVPRWGVWPRTWRWRTPEFLAPEGPASRGSEARLPRADRGPGCGVKPTEGTESGWAPAATPESAGIGLSEKLEAGGLSAQLKPRPRVEPQSEAARGRAAQSGGGRRASSPAAAEVSEGGLGAQVWSRPVGVRRGGAPGGGRPRESKRAGPRSRMRRWAAGRGGSEARR